MLLHLNPNSGLPVYRQMVQQLRERIASGQLPAHAQIPSVRELSAELSVNPLTVSKVYQILEREGLVEFRRGQGTFVTGGRKNASLTEQKRMIQPAIDQVVSEAIHLGLSQEQIQNLISQSYARRTP